MPSAKVLSELLRTLYAAPTTPELWPVFLSNFTKVCNLSGAAILSQDFKKAHYGFHAAVGLDPDVLPLYEKYYGAMDAWRPRFLHKAEGELVFGEALCPFSELSQTEYYNDFLFRIDIELFCAVPTVKRPAGIELISFYKGWKDKAPSRDARDLIQLVLPHLDNALRIRARLVELETKTTFIRALDMLDSGVALLDKSGSCLFVNRAAEQILNEKVGLYIKESRLFASKPSESLVLRSLIDRTVAAGFDGVASRGGAMLITRLSKTPIRVVIAPFACEDQSGAGKATAVVFMSDPDRQSATLTSVLQSLYGLTPAECNLAELLAAGHTLAEACDLNRVARETVRSQLRSIFNKTGARRQSELIRILTSLPRLNVHAA